MIAVSPAGPLGGQLPDRATLMRRRRTRPGSEPARRIAIVVAYAVRGVVSTRAPGPMPVRRRAISRASRPLPDADHVADSPPSGQVFLEPRNLLAEDQLPTATYTIQRSERVFAYHLPLGREIVCRHRVQFSVVHELSSRLPVLLCKALGVGHMLRWVCSRIRLRA